MRSRIIVTRTAGHVPVAGNLINQTISELFELLHTRDIKIDEEQGDNAILSIPRLEPVRRTMVEWALRDIMQRKEIGVEVSIV